MKQLFLYAWQFPQNILGVIALNIFKPDKRYILDNGVEIYYSNYIKGSVSMGKYVIVNSSHWRHSVEESLKRDTVRHCAIGHVRQSMKLGWLYPLIITIPAWIARVTYKNKYRYLNFFTERWADKLADVQRS